MPANLVSQIVRTTTALLNDVNDSVIGDSSTAGTGASQFIGQLGQRVALGPDEVRFDSAIGTLYGGVYQYVRFGVTEAVTPALGLLAFWDGAVADDLYQVTTTEPTGVSDIAGIILNAVTKGNYGFIQTAGKATVKFKGTTTKTTPAVGDLVVAAADATATADVLADATALTSVQARHILGIALAAPVGGAASTVRLRTPWMSSV